MYQVYRSYGRKNLHITITQKVERNQIKNTIRIWNLCAERNLVKDNKKKAYKIKPVKDLHRFFLNN